MPLGSRPRLIALLFVWLSTSFAATPQAQLPTVEMRVAWPTGGQVGTELELQVAVGDHLDEVRSLWFSHDGIRAEVLQGDPLPLDDTPQPRDGHFRVTVAADVPPGVYDVRALGRFGISNPRAFVVSDAPHAVVSDPRSSEEAAAEIAVQTVVQAQAAAQQIDHYRLHLEAGRVVRIRCRAREIDSLLTAVVTLRDEQGQQRARGRATDTNDPELTWEVPETGHYTIQVHDLLYRGGPEYFYHLQVADTDNHADRLEPRAREIVGDDWSARQSAAGAADATPLEVSVPAVVAGRFEHAQDTGVVELEAEAGDVYYLEVLSHQLGAATDPHLLVQRVEPRGDDPPQFTRILEQDDVERFPGSMLRQIQKDPLLRFVVPATGRYRVVVRDLQDAGDPGDEKRYWLWIRRPAADFELVAFQPHPSGIAAQSRPVGALLRRGGTMAIEVAVTPRDGFLEPLQGRHTVVPGELSVPYELPWQWPIEVRAEGLPEGVECPPIQLHSGQRRATLLLRASETASAWTGPIRIVGRVTAPPESMERPAGAAAMVWPDPSGRGAVATRPCDALMLHVTDLESAPLRIDLGTEAEYSVAREANVEIPVRITRGESAKGKITLRAHGLPADVRAADVEVEPDQSEATWTLQVGANAPPGRFHPWVIAETQVAYARNPQALERAEQYLAGLQQRLADLPPAEAESTETESADAESAASEAAELKAALEQAIQAAQQRVEQLGSETQAADTRLYEPSSAVQLNIQ